MQDYLSLASMPLLKVTAEEYNTWRTSIVTKALKQELMIAFLAQMTDPLPCDSNVAYPIMHQREGARQALDMIFEWMPENIRLSISKGEEVTIED
ncbi:MAG: hypothetical protein V4563_17580 [Pseudomonadota bacterium]